jgi:sarcosine oxidase subunit gamma
MADNAPVKSAGGAVRPLPPAARLSLRIKDNGAQMPRAVAGLTLDQPINRVATSGERLAARLGPDEWLIIGAPSDADALGSAITKTLADRFHALVDVSHASVAFAVDGPDAANILNAGCPLDLDIGSFPAGSATRTILGKCEIILIRLNEREFRVECWRSFGEYVHAFLLEAAALNGSAHPMVKEVHS